VSDRLDAQAEAELLNAALAGKPIDKVTLEAERDADADPRVETV
jgi:hypothetical protein